jgi:hypothetical protein
MATIDIALPDELMEALTPPNCSAMQLPSPPDLPQLMLPVGVSLQGVADFTRGVPTDCSMNFSLVAQLAPMMASMECLLAVLQFFGDVVGSNPTNLVPNIISGLEKVASCATMATPAGLFCFIKGLLGLMASMLKCIVEALESTLSIVSGLQVQISAAQAAGNTDLLAALTCSQENAQAAAAGTIQSLQPVTVLLSLAAPFLKIAQIPISFTIPSGVDASDLQAMQTLLQTLGEVAQTIETIAGTIKC